MRGPKCGAAPCPPAIRTFSPPVPPLRWALGSITVTVADRMALSRLDPGNTLTHQQAKTAACTACQITPVPHLLPSRPPSTFALARAPCPSAACDVQRRTRARPPSLRLHNQAHSPLSKDDSSHLPTKQRKPTSVAHAFLPRLPPNNRRPSGPCTLTSDRACPPRGAGARVRSLGQGRRSAPSNAQLRIRLFPLSLQHITIPS